MSVICRNLCFLVLNTKLFIYRMVRNYKRLPGARVYKNYDDATLQLALAAVNNGMSLQKASTIYKISVGTLFNKVHKKHGNKVGKPLTLGSEEEGIIVQYILTTAESGFPFDAADVKYLVPAYL